MLFLVRIIYTVWECDEDDDGLQKIYIYNNNDLNFKISI